MTDKELRRLRRRDLLEMLVEAENRNEALIEENHQLREQQKNREIRISKAGSIADAALQLSGIFEAAQEAAAQYVESVRKISEEPERTAELILAEARRRAEEIEAEAGKKAAGEAERRHE